jgi:hypothetical protein
MQKPTSPVAQRMRTVRRGVIAGAVAIFITVWVAVAALGKGGTSSAATSAPSTSSDSSGTTQSQSDDGGVSSQQSQQSQPDPVTTGQS